MNAKMKNPFEGLQIDSHEPLHRVTTRTKCPECSASRKYFCYKCYVPMQDIAGTFRTAKLPLKVDIIKHHLERDGKSTAVHARLLAPEDVTIYTYPDMPQFENKEKVLLVFPYKDAVSLQDLVKQRTVSQSKAKQEQCQMDKPSFLHVCDDHKRDKPCKTDTQSSMMEQNTTKTSSSSQTNQDCIHVTYKGTCGCSCLLESGHSSQSYPESTTSELISKEECHRLTDRHPSKNLQTGSQETDPQSATSELKTKGKSHHLTNEQTTVKLKPDSQEKDPILSNSLSGSHCCHQNVHSNSSDILTTVADRQEHMINKRKGCLEEGLFERVIFIDSTWNQCGAISRDERLAGIKRVVLQDRRTTFWRSQHCKPQTYLATIEAIYYFLIDYHNIVLGEDYSGQYDNLLFFYSFMHNLVQKTAEEREILSQKGKT